VIKIKWNDIFKIDLEDLKDQITKLTFEDVETLINHDTFK